jgi:hypothetical protein
MSNEVTNASEQNPKPAPVMRLPGISETTGSQVSILLSILSATYPLCLKGAGLTHVETGDKPELDGGVQMAAAVTLVRVLDRLDHILGERSRWGNGGIPHQIRLVNKTLELQQRSIREQLRVMQETQRPSRFLNPKIFFDPEHALWIATADSIPGALALYGIGSTPAEAMLRLDSEYFQSQLAEQARHAKAMKKDQPPEIPVVAKANKRKKDV